MMHKVVIKAVSLILDIDMSVTLTDRILWRSIHSKSCRYYSQKKKRLFSLEVFIIITLQLHLRSALSHGFDHKNNVYSF